MSKYLASLAHPSELYALGKASVVFRAGRVETPGREDAQYAFWRCYHYLNLTSRSFSRVIQALDPELRHAVCVFYLVLRGLDTVEDDMSLSVERKEAVLSAFHSTLKEPGWTFTESGPAEKDRALLAEFNVVIEEFLSLRTDFQSTISDVCESMAEGMVEFRRRPRVATVDDYNRYAHYVAGLVGIGLTRLFISSGLEPALDSITSGASLDVTPVGIERLADRMGLFLQKVNIIKDIREDFVDGRWFWPRAVWARFLGLDSGDPSGVESGVYSKVSSKLDSGVDLGDVFGVASDDATTPASTPATKDTITKESTETTAADLRDLSILFSTTNRPQALATLNHLCVDALTLVPDCLEYLAKLKNPSVFRFCAIPQVMALATFTLFFNNPEIFTTTTGLKIRRGATVKLMLECTSMAALSKVYMCHVHELRKKNMARMTGNDNKHDDSFLGMSVVLGQIEQTLARLTPPQDQDKVSLLDHIFMILVLSVAVYMGLTGFIPDFVKQRVHALVSVSQ